MCDVLCELVLIKRNGQDGPHYPVYVAANECLFGRDLDCDVRIQMSNVSRQHARLYGGDTKQPWIENLSKTSKTWVNDISVEEPTSLQDGDVIRISDRLFRCQLKKPTSPLAPTQKMGVEAEKPAKTPDKVASKHSPGVENSNQLSKLPSPVMNEIHKKRQASLESTSSGQERSPSREDSARAMALPRPRLATPIRHAIENRRKSTGASKSSATKAAPKVRVSLPGSMSPRPPASHRRSSPLVAQFVSVTPQGSLSSGAKLAHSKSQRSLSPVEEENDLSGYAADSPQMKKFNVTDGPSRVTPGKRRSVRFGPLLSPEEFDKRLPPNTPVKVGKTPTGRRRSSPGVVKTPQSRQLKNFSLAVVSSDVITPMMVDTGTQQNMTADACSTSTSETLAPRPRMNTPLRKAIEQRARHPGNDSNSPVCDKSTEDATDVPAHEVVGSVEKTSRKRMATPMRKAIEGGFQMKISKKKMATPVRKQIESGIQLRATRKRMATPLKCAIQDGAKLKQLKASKKKLATPVRKQIESGVQLRTTRRMATPLRRAIEAGTELKQLRKMMTPLKQQLEQDTNLKSTNELHDPVNAALPRKRMATPVKNAIEAGVQLKAFRKRLATPTRKQIESGVRLRSTRKRLATPMKQEITQGVQLRTTKRRMATPMKLAIMHGIELRQLHRKMKTPLRKQIESGTELKATRKRLATPPKNAIQGGSTLRKTTKRLATPLKRAIQGGSTLRKTTKRLATPLRNQIRQGKTLKAMKRKLATPVRNQIKKGLRLRSAVAKKTAPVQRVRMMDSLPTMDTITGSEIVKSESCRARAKKQTDIQSRVKLTAVRRLKPTQNLLKQKVFHFSAQPTSVGMGMPDSMMSPAPKRARTVQAKDAVSTPELDGLKRLVKTPRSKQSTSVPEDNFESGIFATPHITRSKSRCSPSPALDGIQHLMKTPHSKVAHGNFSPSLDGIQRVIRSPRYVLRPVDQSPSLDGIARLMKTPTTKQPTQILGVGTSPQLDGVARLIKTPKEKNSAMPETNFQSHLFTTPKTRNKGSDTFQSPEKYFNAQLFDMVIDEEASEEPVPSDVISSAPPMSQSSGRRSARTRKRTARVKLVDEQPVKRQRKTVCKVEPTEVHPTMTRARRKTLTAAATMKFDTETGDSAEHNQDLPVKGQHTATHDETAEVPMRIHMTRTRRKTMMAGSIDCSITDNTETTPVASGTTTRSRRKTVRSQPLAVPDAGTNSESHPFSEEVPVTRSKRPATKSQKVANIEGTLNEQPTSGHTRGRKALTKSVTTDHETVTTREKFQRPVGGAKVPKQVAKVVASGKSTKKAVKFVESVMESVDSQIQSSPRVRTTRSENSSAGPNSLRPLTRSRTRSQASKTKQ